MARHLGQHAIVVGGSMAGLMTARVACRPFRPGHHTRTRPHRQPACGPQIYSAGKPYPFASAGRTARARFSLSRFH